MIDQILADTKLRPQAFRWDEPVSVGELAAWSAHTRIQLPPDLKELWRVLGGGELFEGETVLSPIGEEAMGENVEYFNRLARHRGLPVGYLIFHVGSCVSAVRLADQKYIEMDATSFKEIGEYGTIDDWYRNVLRNEYASRYGLK